MLPADGVSLDDKRAVTSALLKSGAAIDEMNTVRKHLSGIKGGRLASMAHPAEVVTLAISDVPGDSPAVIASGPTVPDPTTRQDALAVIAKYKIDAPAAVMKHLSTAECETPKPGDAIFERVQNILIATPQGSLDAAAAVVAWTKSGRSGIVVPIPILPPLVCRPIGWILPLLAALI